MDGLTQMHSPSEPRLERTIDEIPEEQLDHDLAEARRLLRDGDREGAVRQTLETLNKGGIGMMTLAEFRSILDAAGRDDIASKIREQMLGVLDTVEKDKIERPQELAHAAMIRLELDDVVGAERCAANAFAAAPTDHKLLFLFTLAMLKADTFALHRLNPEPALAGVENAVALLTSLASMLGNFGHDDDALALLDSCERHCNTPADRTRIDSLRAGLTDQDLAIDQRTMATGIFDHFAESYDQKLAHLGNNGPEIIAEALQILGLPADGSRDILDAGCGTGLCAPYLRPYARHLHGLDLSIPMLEKCRAKDSFDLLTRTDLAVRDTFPQGDFDLAVSGDVLVYFGALDTVFANIFDILRPGGRFIFTVEEAPTPAPARGYGYTPSGRNHHSEGYIRDVLARTGFGTVDLMHRDTLRFEFGNPIAGLAMSACKPV